MSRRREDCPERRVTACDAGGTINEPARRSGWRRAATLDELDGTPGDGRTLLWARIPEVLDGVDGAALAVLGDFVPMGVGQALGDPRRRQQPRQHAAHRRASCRPTGCCSTSASTPSSAASATASCTCSPRTAPCWPPPARAASCATGEPSRHDHRADAGRRRTQPMPRLASIALPCDDAAVRPGMTVPLPGPLHTHRDKLAELADLGYTDIWSAEADGADAFTPLALAAAWEPRLRLGHGDRARLHPGAGVLRPERRLAGRRRPGPVRHRHRLVEQRDRRAVERRAVRRAVQEGARRRALPARRAGGREGRQATYDTFEIQGFRLGIRPEQTPPILVAALREGMLRLAGREADGAIINWLSPDDVPTVAGVVQRRRRRRRARDRGPHLRVPEREHRRRAGRRPSSPSRRTSTCRCTPSSTAGSGAASSCRACGTPGRPATARRRWAAIPDEVVDDLVVHGSPAALPGAHPGVLRQRRDDEQPGHHAARPRARPLGRRARPVAQRWLSRRRAWRSPAHAAVRSRRPSVAATTGRGGCARAGRGSRRRGAGHAAAWRRRGGSAPARPPSGSRVSCSGWTVVLEVMPTIMTRGCHSDGDGLSWGDVARPRDGRQAEPGPDLGLDHRGSLFVASTVGDELLALEQLEHRLGLLVVVAQPRRRAPPGCRPRGRPARRRRRRSGRPPSGGGRSGCSRARTREHSRRASTRRATSSSGSSRWITPSMS